MARQSEAQGTGLSPGAEVEGEELDALAMRAQGGETAALGVLWEAAQPIMAPVLRRYAFRGREGPLEAADLAQQGFVILAELVADWQGRGPFVAWLRRLFPLAIIRYRRSLLHWDGPTVESLPHAELATLLESGAAAEPDPFDTVLCRQLLAELPPPYRSLILWRFVHGLPYREIERLHGVPAATAQVRCERALAYLRDKAEGRPATPLRRVKTPLPRPSPDAKTVVRKLWALATTGDGLLPAAGEAAAALGLGRRAYDDLVARLEAAGCLAAASVSFASRKGRRRRLAVARDEALRRLALADAG
jgi:RNA polymerase sigma factor (sigma-70 family)